MIISELLPKKTYIWDFEFFGSRIYNYVDAVLYSVLNMSQIAYNVNQ